MGYFANLYLINSTATADEIEITTTVLGAGINPTAYFSWGVGERQAGMHAYAERTLFADTMLMALPGYPLVERYGTQPEQDPDRYLLEASFAPRHQDDPVLFHLLLPPSFIPRRDQLPLVQPCAPFVSRLNDRLVVTYPAIGSAEIRFWIQRLESNESLDDYDIPMILHALTPRAVRAEFEFNLGVFKVKFA